MNQKLPSSFYNLTTLIGTVIAIVSFGLILFMMLLEAMTNEPKPYMGVIAFVILPSILLLGVGVMVGGIVREHRRERLGKPHGMHLPQVDLNNPRHRRAFVASVIGTILLLLFSAFGSFQAYEATDSDQFCGETCHTVMKPEFTAYQFSPHARVGCVKCHIGPGAGWFVRSKLSGAYQVYATIFNKYPTPIPTPIENLRPAQETCEQCHWPSHFFNETRHIKSYYLSDEKNTGWKLDLLMKIGGGNAEAGPTSGIHWHMNIANEVEYIALDNKRQVIPWVRVKTTDGKEHIYKSPEIEVSEDSLKHGFRRRMDCIDCHNRPTHIYNPPARSVNHVISLGWVDSTLPNVKSYAVEALEAGYQTTQGGIDSIALFMNERYASEYPEVAKQKRKEIDRAITELQNIYSRNYFPEMKVDWKQFNDNIGHMYYPGCFRCHDGKHMNEEGKILSRDCNTCHTILDQEQAGEGLRLSLGGVEYKHPVDIGEIWKEMNCSDCHNPQ